MKTSAHIFRFDPNKDAAPYFQEFEFEYEDGENVLDVLTQIQKVDTSLGFLYECRDRHCGLCGVMVNGKAVLACKTSAVPGMKIEPLKGMRVLKDLVIDRSEFSNQKASLRLYLERRNEPEQLPERLLPEEYKEFKLASRCVECYCCTASCPVWQKKRHVFAGPTAIMLEARHVFDGRDDASRDLILRDLGIDACINCGACTRACTHKIDPCALIQKLKSVSK